MIPNHDHRPWPIPDRPWAMAMRWHNLLFLHWPINSSWLRPLIPPALELETYDGQAWIGVVPFYMTGVRPRFVPPLPGLSAFAEINVRTYVTRNNKPGVWFFSLDAANRPAVWMARWSYHLPYYFADISVNDCDGRIRYHSARRAGNAAFAAEYWPTAAVYHAPPGSIDRWFTERYCLYAADKKGQVYRGDIHHVPWPLQPAAAEIHNNSMTAPLGFDLPNAKPLLHFSRHLDVVAWRLQAA